MTKGKSAFASPEQVAEQVFALRVWLAHAELQVCIHKLRTMRKAQPQLYHDVMEHIRAENRGEGST